MKLIFFLTLSVISPYLSFAHAQAELEVLDTTHYVLSLQKHRIETQILDALSHCNQTFLAPFDESLQLFQNPKFGAMQITNQPGKCLMDCVMRMVGVMSDNGGFNKDTYIKQIRQLRYNYTSYDVNDIKEPKQREEILTTIKELGQTELNYEMIQTYEYAAYSCVVPKDPEYDECEYSYRVLQCIVGKCRYDGFNNPFYPVFSISRWGLKN